VDHLYSLPVLIKYLRQQLTGKTTVVSPDLGGLKMASAIRERCVRICHRGKGAPQRDGDRGALSHSEVEGRDVLSG